LKPSALAALLLALMGLGGLGIILFKDEPPPRMIPETSDRFPAIEDLCGLVAYGGTPRPTQTRGDTTLLVMDLNGSLYSLPQANLYLTRALRQAGCRHDSTVLMPDSSLVFYAWTPEGLPLRLVLEPVGSI
jgi:hypothetical protein